MEYSDYSAIVNAITGGFGGPTGLISLLAGLVGTCVTFAVLWWVARKIVSVVTGAVKSGRISLGGSGRRRR